jgi:hypothetical protein
MSSLLTLKNLEKGLLLLPQGGPFEGSHMHSTSSTFELMFHH